METRCFFRACKNPVAYEVTKRWNGKIVHACEDHRPGQRGLWMPLASGPSAPAPSGRRYSNDFYAVVPVK